MHGIVGTLVDDVVGPPGVDPVELQPKDPIRDVAHLGRRQRNPVRIAVEERHPSPIRDDRDRVAGEQGTSPLGTGRPEQDGRSVEVAADADEPDPREEIDLVLLEALKRAAAEKR